MSLKNNKEIIHRYEKLREYRLYPSLERNVLTKEGMTNWITTWECLNRPEEVKKENNTISVSTECLNSKTIDGFMINEAIVIMSSLIQEKLRGLYDGISKDK